MATKGLVRLHEPSLREDLNEACRKSLYKEANGIKIVEMNQSPEMKRCWLSLYKQLLKGLRMVDTDYVGICEHDCLYSHEHLQWIPPRDDTFYYNSNCWLYQLENKNHPELDRMFSYWPKREALSQLVCSRKLLMESVEERLELIDAGFNYSKRAGEPGFFPKKFLENAAKWASSGKPNHLCGMLENHIKKFKASRFTTEIPNVDIRHGSNFTGPKRGKKRCYEITYWGRLENIIKENKGD